MDVSQFISKYHKQINFNYSGEGLKFEVSQFLFSSAKIDGGTFALIDSLRKNSNIDYSKILDLGCGWGPIAVVLKKTRPNSEVYASDRDALAVEFTKHNAKINNCEIIVKASLDYQNIKEKFSLICCNYPAKAGINALKKFVYTASEHLNKDGILAIVIVKELLDDFKSILNEDMDIIYESKSKGHIVFHIKFKKLIEFDSNIYTKNKIEYKLENKKYYLETAFNVAEFDSMGHATESIILAIKNLQNVKSASVLNPFQGHLAIAAEHYLKPLELNLISRDLLSLNYSKSNLEKNGFKCNTEHTIMPEKKADILLWNIEDLEQEQFNLIYNRIKQLYSSIILSGKRYFIGRITKLYHLKPVKSYDFKGFKSIILIESCKQAIK